METIFKEDTAETTRTISGHQARPIQRAWFTTTTHQSQWGGEVAHSITESARTTTRIAFKVQPERLKTKQCTEEWQDRIPQLREERMQWQHPPFKEGTDLLLHTAERLWQAKRRTTCRTLSSISLTSNSSNRSYHRWMGNVVTDS